MMLCYQAGAAATYGCRKGNDLLNHTRYLIKLAAREEEDDEEQQRERWKEETRQYEKTKHRLLHPHKAR